ncbi:hypothetical protein E2542_SST13289 [Spatholobus suberectus]|nr:hypothetical protein E2542_SST13289 [Spatholobus suberectus]
MRKKGVPSGTVVEGDVGVGKGQGGRDGEVERATLTRNGLGPGSGRWRGGAGSLRMGRRGGLTQQRSFSRLAPESVSQTRSGLEPSQELGELC